MKTLYYCILLLIALTVSAFAQVQETPFDRFSRLKEVEVHVCITWEQRREWTVLQEYKSIPDTSYVASGYDKDHWVATPYFESEWRGVLKFDRSFINDDGDRQLVFRGDLEGYISGIEIRKHTFNRDVSEGTAEWQDLAFGYIFDTQTDSLNDFSDGLVYLDITRKGYKFSISGDSKYGEGQENFVEWRYNRYMNGKQATYSHESNESTEPYVTYWCRHCYPMPIEKPLPAQGLVLEGGEIFRFVHKNEANHQEHCRHDVIWRFTPVQPKKNVRAVITAPPAVKRGDVVHLSGSESTGEITEYKWTFKASNSNPDGVQPNSNASILGQEADVTLLDTTQVTLTVTDGTDTDSTTRTVHVLARSPMEFGTKSEHVDEEGIFKGIKPEGTPEGFDKETWKASDNVCVVDPDAPFHWLHPSPKSAVAIPPKDADDKDTNIVMSVSEEMFTLATVKDEGPWNGFSWFKDWNLSMKRQTRLNEYLLPDGPVLPGQTRNFYNVNEKYVVDRYLNALREHEKNHGYLAKWGLVQGDPAGECESMYDKDAGKLRNDVLKTVREAEDRITKSSADPLRKTWEGDLLIFREGTGEIIRITTQVGEDGGK